LPAFPVTEPTAAGFAAAIRWGLEILRFGNLENGSVSEASGQGGEQGPASRREKKAPTRIASVRAQDNRWWWEAVDAGRLPIQRCADCQTLRHPPRPMCGQCQSLSWDSIDSGMAGEIVSFTALHYPQFPGYPSPVICAVIRLDEGVNFVANIVDSEPGEIAIGQRVQGRIEVIDENNTLPQFARVEDDARATGEEDSR
jgi:uncharacterized OB-fold protein